MSGTGRHKPLGGINETHRLGESRTGSSALISALQTCNTLKARDGDNCKDLHGRGICAACTLKYGIPCSPIAQPEPKYRNQQFQGAAGLSLTHHYSLWRQACPLCCWAVWWGGDRRRSRRWCPPGCVCTLHCCPEWIKIQRIHRVPFRQLFHQRALQGRCTSQIRCERSPQKAFTSSGEVTEQTWDPTPLHCCYLTFTMSAIQFLSIHKHLLWAYLGISWHLRGVNLLKLKWQ